MAQTVQDVLIKLNVDSSDAQKNTELVKKSLDSLGKQIEQTRKYLKAAPEGSKQFEALTKILNNQEQAFELLNNQIKKTDDSSKSLKAQLREMKQRLGELDEGSDEFIKLQKEAGELQDRIGDLNARVKTFASDTANLDAAIEGVSVVAASFGAVQGSMAALGIESENVEKTLSKLAGITTLLNSLQTIQNALQKESALRTILTDKATKGLAVTQSFLSKTFKLSEGAAKGFGKAIMATGIGALVLGLTMLIGNFDKVYAYLIKVVPQLEGFGNQIKGIVNSVTDFFGITSEEERKATAQRKKNSKEIDDIIKKQEEDLRYNGQNYDEYTKRKKEADIEYSKAKKQISEDEVLSEKEKQRLIAAEEKLLSDTKIQIDKEANKAKEEQRKEDYEKYKANLEKIQQALEDYQKKVKAIEESIEDGNIELMEEGQQKELAILNERVQDQLDALKLEQEEFKKSKHATEADLQKFKDREKQIIDIGENDKKKITKKYTEEEKQAKLDAYNETLDIQIKATENEALLRKTNVEQTITNEKEKAVAILQIELETSQKLLEILKKRAEADGILSEDEKLQIEEAGINIIRLMNDIKAAKEEAADTPLISEEAKEAFDIAAEGIQQTISTISEAFKQSFDQQNKELDAYTKNQIDSINESGLTELQKQRKIQKVEEEAAQKRYQLQVEEFNFIKGLQIAQAVISGAQAILSILAVPDFTFGVLSGIRLGIAAAATAANVAIISAQQPPSPPQFYEGGYTGDGNPREVSTSLGNKDYTYHKGEYVVPNKVLRSKEGSALVSHLEGMRLNNNTSLGLTGFADGGFTTSTMAQNVQSKLEAQIMSNMIADTLSRVQIITKVTDINRVNNNLAQTKAKATIR